MSDSYQELMGIYEDKDGLMQSDLESMKGANMFSSFYETLKHVNEYNHKFPDVDTGNQIDLERVAHVSQTLWCPSHAFCVTSSLTIA